MRARIVATGAVVVAVGAGAYALRPGREDNANAANDGVPLSTAAVQRRDLLDRADIDGTLSFAQTGAVSASRAGTLTRLRGEGDVVRRGKSIMSIDAKATAWVLYGKVPMYRDLGPSSDDGRDIRQLERNLVKLGYDPGTVDDDWTSATTAAVKAFQDDRDLTETGTLARTDVVISDGPARIGEHRAEVGDAVRPSGPVTTLTAQSPSVTAKLDAAYAEDVKPGAAADVTLPDGRTVAGRVTEVGSVAQAGQDGGAATVALRVRLKAKRHGRLDGAPVSVSLVTATTRDALAVPVTALVATEPSHYAVELAGSHRLAPVELGAFADGWVQVSGGGLTEGTRVVVPR
jgi:peptidoglycan hydrolase-like protein with peptidoglycan-binding domain